MTDVSTAPAPASNDTLSLHTTDPAAQLAPPDNPVRPGQALAPFRAQLHPPRAHRLSAERLHEIDIAPTEIRVHPDLPPIPAWGYGFYGAATSPGPLLEVAAGQRTRVRWRNRLPASSYPNDPHRPPASLPFATAVLPDPNFDTDSVLNHLGTGGGGPENTSGAPIGWITTHLHGGHTHPDSDGWPDNMVPTGGSQLTGYDNTYDNAELGLAKVGEYLWYHDHAMNGTRYHVFAGLAGGYLVRDPREHQLGLPTRADQGEVVLIMADRNLDVADGTPRLLHKTTTDTAEFFGPLTLVNGRLWPRLPLRPEVYRLRVLNGSNARAYRLHLVSVQDGPDGAPVVTAHHDRVLVIGTDAGLLWRGWQLGNDQALTMAPAERFDVLVNLDGLPAGAQLYVVNSAQAPFGGAAPPELADLIQHGDRTKRNPYPWVLRIDVDPDAPTPGRPASLFAATAAAELNPAFRRLAHNAPAPTPDEPPTLSIGDHDHATILLAETYPPGHLYVQEIVPDPAGTIDLQLPGEAAPTTYRVDGWMAADPMPSSSRVSFYDHIALRPQLGRWQVWKFVNTTGDTHPIHIHQSTFQPLDATAGRLVFADAGGKNRYDPDTRRTSAALVPETDPANPPRAYEPHEMHGWKEVIRVDPGNVVKVAIRFDLAGRYVYHCHVLEHEDTEMMRPFVVPVTPMNDGMGGMHH
jgi:FtsP/CotA-like multicopper oxidase with cupredoxin domain